MFDPEILAALRVSLALTTSVFAALLFITPPIAAAIVSMPRCIRVVLEPLVLLPIILPPTVLGFYFLISTGRDSWFANLLGWILPVPLAFSFFGLVVACIVASGPFAIRSMVTALDSVDRDQIDAAKCLGLGPVERFFRLSLPASRRGLVSGLAMSAAHTMGSFGVVLMVGGSLPGHTKTLSILIYDQTESLQYSSAHCGSIWMIFSGILLLIVVERFSVRG